MTEQRISTVRLSSSPDWDRLRSELRERLAAADYVPEQLGLVRVDERTAVLLVRSADAEALGRCWAAVVEPWLRAEGLVEDGAGQQGELVVDHRVEREDAARSVAAAGVGRLEHFVRGVVESRTVWGLYAQTWARSTGLADDSEHAQVEALPFWSHSDSAARCVRGPWASYAPRAIELEAFVEQWLVGMVEDGIVAVIAPSPTSPGLVLPAAELAEALRRATDGQ
ncbi:MAG: DUF2750 domain-containing protein [Nannocystaceae bacterium]